MSEALPSWCSELFDAHTMREIDRLAIEGGMVASLELMERAGAQVARIVEEVCGGGEVGIVCGKGNNGGDGLVVARLLRGDGWGVRVLCVSEAREMSEDARVNLEALGVPGASSCGSDGTGVQVIEGLDVGAIAAKLDGVEVVVDGLLGTGFSGRPRGTVGAAIEAVNLCGGQGAKVVSIDVPSGVDASTGEIEGIAVGADLTVTLHGDKVGLWINPGKAHAGSVRTVDIGLGTHSMRPSLTAGGAPPGGHRVQYAQGQIGLIEDRVREGLPERGASSTKLMSGHVVLVGGSRGLTGAPSMAARGCIRAGAGYVTACVPGSLEGVITGRMPVEVMTRALPDGEGGLEVGGVEIVLDVVGRGGALALGPGLGRGESAFALAREVARRAPVAMVLDADGLNAHAGRLEALREREAPTVLTPHAGELGRLLEVDSDEIERHRLDHVKRAACTAGAVVVLKGDDTLIADREGRVAISPGGSPALATAGTGDALTGVIAALLSQGVAPFTAAAAGVWIHAAAGREAARRVGCVEGVITSDVIAALPWARGEKALPGRDRVH